MGNDNKARVSTKNALAEKVVRWELEARGRVQRVGYRDMVEEVARVLNLVGKVENDSDDDQLVRVVVQGPESTLSEFVKAIGGRHGFADATVKTVSTSEPDPKLVRFTKERGSPEKETLERADQSVLILGKIAEVVSENLGVSKETLAVGKETLAVGKETLAVGKETLAVGKETLTVGKETLAVGKETLTVGKETLAVGKETLTAVREGNKDILIAIKDGSNKTEALHRDFTAGLKHLDSVYGIIGKTLVKIDHDLQEQTREHARASERQTAAILKLAQAIGRTSEVRPPPKIRPRRKRVAKR
jgi:acylphosphatase